jgi:photosystem I subunit VIII
MVDTQKWNLHTRKPFHMTGTYAASYLSWILIPVIGWVLPAVTMGLLFLYIEKDA